MIRKYEKTDIEDVMNIWYNATELAHPFLQDTFVEKVKRDMRELYLPNALTWVYEEDLKVIGFISMLENEIAGLFVIPDEHARGIGTALVNHVGRTHEFLEVEVFEKNEIGRAFYNKYGFSPYRESIHDATQQNVLRLKCTAPKHV